MADNSAHRKYPLIEIGSAGASYTGAISSASDWVGAGNSAARVIAGSEAFRNYSPMIDQIGLNASGNLRGMVVSSNWRTVFKFTGQADSYVGNFGYIASIAAGLVQAAPQIEQISRSSSPTAIKALQLSTIAGTISLRTVLGIIPFGTHLIYLSLEGWSQLAGLVPALQPASQSAVTTLKSADALVQTTFETVTDTSKIGNGLWTVVDFASRQI